jgi:hypothetical protein
MSYRSCLLRLGVSLAVAISAFSARAQDTPVDSAANAPASAAQPAADNTAALAKAIQNPVASLISVPLQNNSNFGIGPSAGHPMKLSDKVMLVTRVIQPIVWQPCAQQPTGEQFGIGDMNPTFFSVAGECRKADLWDWAGVYFADRNELPNSSG